MDEKPLSAKLISSIKSRNSNVIGLINMLIKSFNYLQDLNTFLFNFSIFIIEED